MRSCSIIADDVLNNEEFDCYYYQKFHASSARSREVLQRLVLAKLQSSTIVIIISANTRYEGSLEITCRDPDMVDTTADSLFGSQPDFPTDNFPLQPLKQPPYAADGCRSTFAGTMLPFRMNREPEFSVACRDRVAVI